MVNNADETTAKRFGADVDVSDFYVHIRLLSSGGGINSRTIDPCLTGGFLEWEMWARSDRHRRARPHK
jgi:hypothetical protein